MHGYWLLAVEEAPPPTSSTGLLIYGLTLALVGAVGTSGFQFYKYRKQAEREDDSLIATATNEAVAAAKSMLAEYRLELERYRTEIEALRRELKNAEQRIDNLEEDLSAAQDENSKVKLELQDAIAVRDRLHATVDAMMRRMAELERLVGDTG